MSRIDTRFAELAAKGEKALVCFLTGGDPDLATSESLILELADAGADIIEIGIPFSDPLADGPSIQLATLRSLEAGTTPPSVLDLVKRVRKKSEAPIVLMTYFNPVQKMGLERFASEAALAGADGVIMTDLPPEEALDWKRAADSVGLSTVFLLAPTSTDERIAIAAEMASGFIYCVSRTGVTGARSELSSEIAGFIERIRRVTDKPVAVGFGVSTPEHVREISGFADGAVVGSALVDLIASNKDGQLLAKVREYTGSLKNATK